MYLLFLVLKSNLALASWLTCFPCKLASYAGKRQMISRGHETSFCSMSYRQDLMDGLPGKNKRRKLVVIGQHCVEPLQALQNAGQRKWDKRIQQHGLCDRDCRFEQQMREIYWTWHVERSYKEELKQLIKKEQRWIAEEDKEEEVIGEKVGVSSAMLAAF
ncbi:hypothetical protein PTKIN_Ptkin16aG0082500 [Pterospermum kingtungense]